ncbi:hypothetical protein LTS18_011530, partial [Coniosporium uncinatum]
MSTRKSGRSRVPNKKYTVDAFEGLDLESSASEAEPDLEKQQQTGPVEDSDDEDDEFGEQDAEAAAAEEKEASSGTSSEEGDVSAEELEYTQLVEDDDVSIAWSNGEPSGTPPQSKKQAQGLLKKGERMGKDPGISRKLATFDRRTRAPNSNVRIANVRGIKDIIHHQAKQVRHEYIYGPADEDVIPFIKARDKWFNQATLPTRRVNGQEGGFSYSFYYPEKMRVREKSQGLDWYHDRGGKSTIESNQLFLSVSTKDFRQCMPSPSSQNTVIGP